MYELLEIKCRAGEKRMSKMKPMKQQKVCPNCGAPIVSEICQYCGVATGLNTEQAQMEYPILECKEAVLSFWTLWFPMIFAVVFGIPALIMLPFALVTVIFLFVGLPLFVVGGGAMFVVIRTLVRYSKIKKHGKPIQATVYGYMDDNILINDKPAQIVKLLVETPNGPRFILYSLGKTVKPYAVNSTIDLMVYKNYFMITENKEVVEW